MHYPTNTQKTRNLKQITKYLNKLKSFIFDILKNLTNLNYHEINLHYMNGNKYELKYYIIEYHFNCFLRCFCSFQRLKKTQIKILDFSITNENTSIIRRAYKMYFKTFKVCVSFNSDFPFYCLQISSTN